MKLCLSSWLRLASKVSSNKSVLIYQNWPSHHREERRQRCNNSGELSFTNAHFSRTLRESTSLAGAWCLCMPIDPLLPLASLSLAVCLPECTALRREVSEAMCCYLWCLKRLRTTSKIQEGLCCIEKLKLVWDEFKYRLKTEWIWGATFVNSAVIISTYQPKPKIQLYPENNSRKGQWYYVLRNGSVKNRISHIMAKWEPEKHTSHFRI